MGLLGATGSKSLFLKSDFWACATTQEGDFGDFEGRFWRPSRALIGPILYAMKSSRSPDFFGSKKFWGHIGPSASNTALEIGIFHFSPFLVFWNFDRIFGVLIRFPIIKPKIAHISITFLPTPILFRHIRAIQTPNRPIMPKYTWGW